MELRLTTPGGETVPLKRLHGTAVDMPSSVGLSALVGLCLLAHFKAKQLTDELIDEIESWFEDAVEAEIEARITERTRAWVLGLECAPDAVVDVGDRSEHQSTTAPRAGSPTSSDSYPSTAGSF